MKSKNLIFVEDQLKSTLERVLYETEVQCEFSGGVRSSFLSSDLSVGGLYLKNCRPLETDEFLNVSFYIKVNEREIDVSCRAKVAWVNDENDRRKLDYPPGAGLEFLDLTEDDSSMLSEFIDCYDESKKMNMVCAWCGKHLGMRVGPSGETSHGICGQCKEKYF